MDNKIVSTTYVPLQPPFQIIKYSGDIAMQIGTLIVTIQKEGNVNGLGYQIETHSHPVVAYENKFKAEPNQQLTTHQFLEGAVWNYVEVKDVTTICLTNARLPWREFIDFLWRDVKKRKHCVAEPTIAAYWSLDMLCGGVELPEAKHYVIHLETYFFETGGKKIPVLRSRSDDVFAIHVQINLDLLRTFIHQLMLYSLLWLHECPSSAPFSYSFETDNDILRGFVDKLKSMSFAVNKTIKIDRDTMSKVQEVINVFTKGDGEVEKSK